MGVFFLPHLINSRITFSLDPEIEGFSPRLTTVFIFYGYVIKFSLCHAVTVTLAEKIPSWSYMVTVVSYIPQNLIWTSRSSWLWSWSVTKQNVRL